MHVQENEENCTPMIAEIARGCKLDGIRRPDGGEWNAACGTGHRFSWPVVSPGLHPALQLFQSEIVLLARSPGRSGTGFRLYGEPLYTTLHVIALADLGLLRSNGVVVGCPRLESFYAHAEDCSRMVRV
ncbi:MAG: hypothetical protein JWO80_5314 [Bryobacterales bacterium]|nr:hypothetical protein [Bryobacterales bacterium]